MIKYDNIESSPAGSSLGLPIGRPRGKEQSASPGAAIRNLASGTARAISTALPQGNARLRTMAILFGCAIMVNVISIPFMSFLTRSLGTAGFGTYSIAVAFAFFASIIVDIGASALVIREMVGRTERASGIMAAFIAPKVPIAALCALGGMAVGAAIGYSGSTLTSVVLGTVAGGFMALASATRAVFHAHQRMEFDAVGVLGERVATVGFAFVALALGWGVVGVMLAMAAGNLIDFALSWALVRTRFVPDMRLRGALSRTHATNPAKREHVTRYLRMGTGLLVAGLSIQVYQRCQTLIIGWAWGRDEAGIFAAGFALFSLVTLVAGAVGLLTFPQVSRVAWERGHSALESLARRLVPAVGALGLLLGVALFITADTIVGALYAPEFKQSAVLLRALALAMPFTFMSGQLCQVLVAAGKQGAVGRATAIAALFNVAANLLVIPMAGVQGAAWVQVTTEVLLTAQCCHAVWLWMAETRLATREFGGAADD